jgi:hypothetical protein
MANHLHLAWLLSLFGLLSSSVTQGAILQGGRISQAVGDVRVGEGGAALAKAKTGAVVNGASVQTGPASRAEVVFADQTVLRLGDKTEVTVQPQDRTFDLSAGAILTQVPGGVGRTTVKVHSIIATATGVTLAIECLPKAYTKFISLDGTSRLCLKKNGWATDCVLLRAGQMLIASPEPKSLPEVVDVDLNHLLATTQFITNFPPLPNRDRLTKTATEQQRNKTHGAFADTNLVIFGRGTLVSQRSPAPAASPAKPAHPSSPSPTPVPTR